MCVKGGIMKYYIDVYTFDVYFLLFRVVCPCFNKREGGGGGVPSFVVLYAITVVKLFSYYLDPLFCKLCKDGRHT